MKCQYRSWFSLRRGGPYTQCQHDGVRKHCTKSGDVIYMCNKHYDKAIISKSILLTQRGVRK